MPHDAHVFRRRVRFGAVDVKLFGRSGRDVYPAPRQPARCWSAATQLTCLNIGAMALLLGLWSAFALIWQPQLVQDINSTLGPGRWSGASLRSSCSELVGNLVSAERFNRWHRMNCESVLQLDGRALLGAVAARPASQRLTPGEPTRRLLHSGHASTGSDNRVVVVSVVTSVRCAASAKRVEQLPLATKLLSSIAVTAEPGFEYWVTVAYDAGDSFFDPPLLSTSAWHGDGASALRSWFVKNVQAMLATRGIAIELVLHRVDNPMAHEGVALNFAMRAAFEDGADYLFRAPSDTWLATSWASPMVTALARLHPPNLGVVAARCNAEDKRWIGHHMTHRTHMEVFGAHFYPAVLAPRWLDSWLAALYGGVRASDQPAPVAARGVGTRQPGGAVAALEESSKRVPSTRGLAAPGDILQLEAGMRATPTPAATHVVQSRGFNGDRRGSLGDGGDDGGKATGGMQLVGSSMSVADLIEDPSSLTSMRHIKKQPSLPKKVLAPPPPVAWEMPSRVRKLASVVAVRGGGGHMVDTGGPAPQSRRVLEYAVVDGLDVLVTWLAQQRQALADTVAAPGNEASSIAAQRLSEVDDALEAFGVIQHVAKVHMHKRMHCGTDGLHCSAAAKRAP